MFDRVKYPRTFHLDFSPGIGSDDKVMRSYDLMEGREVVVTIKMDGENCTMGSNYIHARSPDGVYHQSRDWVKGFHGMIKHMIGVGDRICGENLYAQHSISYDQLDSYFYGFSYWSGNRCWDWDSTLELFESLNIVSPKELYRGIFDVAILVGLSNGLDTERDEGYVVRVVDSFTIDDFSRVVAKWVRKGHVETDDHWMFRQIIPNKLRIK